MTVSRREFLAGGIAVGTAGVLARGGEIIGATGTSAAGAAGSFSFVHLTDQHVTHRRHAPEGYAKCIAAINSIQREPDVVRLGGVMVFDGCDTARDDYTNQIRLFKVMTR